MATAFLAARPVNYETGYDSPLPSPAAETALRRAFGWFEGSAATLRVATIPMSTAAAAIMLPSESANTAVQRLGRLASVGWPGLNDADNTATAAPAAYRDDSEDAEPSTGSPADSSCCSEGTGTSDDLDTDTEDHYIEAVYLTDGTVAYAAASSAPVDYFGNGDAAAGDSASSSNDYLDYYGGGSGNSGHALTPDALAGPAAVPSLAIDPWALGAGAADTDAIVADMEDPSQSAASPSFGTLPGSPMSTARPRMRKLALAPAPTSRKKRRKLAAAATAAAAAASAGAPHRKKRRSRMLSPEELAARQERARCRQVKNRIAAKRCRQRKVDHFKVLKVEVGQIRYENSRLTAQVAAAAAELAALRSALQL